MRLPGNPVATSALTAAVTSAATTAATLGAVRLATTARMRLAERRHARHHRDDVDEDAPCELDAGPYPGEPFVLHDVDGSGTGPCIAALRERYLVEDGSATEILQNFDYMDLMRAFAEVTLVLAMDLADTQFEPCGCDDEDCPNQEPDPEMHHMVAGRYLLYAAQSFEAKHLQHVQFCDVCAEAGYVAPGLVRAQFARDVADDLICNAGDDIVLSGVPLQAAFDVVCNLLEVIANITGESPEDQINDLGKGLARLTAYSEGVRPPAS